MVENLYCGPVETISGMREDPWIPIRKVFDKTALLAWRRLRGLRVVSFMRDASHAHSGSTCNSAGKVGDVRTGGVVTENGEGEPQWLNSGSRRYFEMALLALVGGWGFFANLHLSLLEGSEGLYAGIAGEMGRRREFFDLTYHDVPYFNKPPLFFWLLNMLE